MCELCGSKEEVEKEKILLGYKIDHLNSLSWLLASLANGSIKPHSEAACGISSLSSKVIQDIAEYL